MNSRSLCLVIAASFVFQCIHIGDASVVEREKRDDNVWRVTTLIEKPYVIRKRHPALSNDDYEGYIPDVLKKIGEKLNQKYRIQEVDDGKYGMYDQSRGKWTGMIGAVISGTADLAAAPITINQARRDAVDFTTPFMTFGTVVLLANPTNGSAHSAKTVHDLLGQTGLRYGVVNDGSTAQLIRSENSDPDIARLRERLDEVDTQEHGVTRIRSARGKFAFVIEEKTANFWKKQEPCDLTTIPLTMLGTRDYALALRKHSPHTEKINKVLREMKDNHELDDLETKWWSGPCSGGSRLTFEFMALTLSAFLGAIFHSVKF